MSKVDFPVTSDYWIKLGSVLGKKVIIQAVEITKKKKRVTGHHANDRVDQACAEGSVEITSRFFQQNLGISKFTR